MKKNILPGILFFFSLQLSIFFAKAQVLYGTTFAGGVTFGAGVSDRGKGAIIKFTPGTDSLVVAKSFERNASWPVYTSFLQASDGKLYGLTSEGGNYNMGAIFSFDPVSAAYAKLKDFDTTNGAGPFGSLIQAKDGKLYGMTSRGGTSNAGVIFSFDPSTSTFVKHKDFVDTAGARSYGSLLQAKNGKLYGMASSGGSGGQGVIFSFDPSTSTYIKLKDFNGSNGAYPQGSLIQAANGKLYGMTVQGGGKDQGVIFSFDPSSFVYKKLKDFNGTNGARPGGSLFEAKDGKLYGMTSSGGSGSFFSNGVIFSFDPLSSTYTNLKDFDSTGGRPVGNLMQATDGKLYGLTSEGGHHGYGVLFSFDPSSSTYARLKDFDWASGFRPYGSLMQAGDGKLYGMTYYEGIGKHRFGDGAIFSFDPSSSSYAKLWSFITNENGSHASASLIYGKDNKLYGMTHNDGKNGAGVIFSFDPASSIYTKLFDFNYANGANPYGSLLQASDGKLYGMTNQGGKKKLGVIFSFDPSTLIYRKLTDFDDINGSTPYGSLMQAKDGKLYGMTSRGGTGFGSGFGVIFSIDPSTSIYTKLKIFDGSDGAYPSGSLMQASDGKLYGLAGVLFSFDPSSSAYTKLKDFNNLTGQLGSVLEGKDKKLYGIEFDARTTQGGAIFSFDPSSSVYVTLKNFKGLDGWGVYGQLMQASDGKLYGMTNIGGSRGYGVIFSFDPLTSTYAKHKDFNGTNGAYPYYGSGFIEVLKSGTPPTVSLTTPANNATYLSGANVYLTAAASDADGTISDVKFYSDTTLLYTSTDTPYAFKWEKVKKGNYTLTAKAKDNSGLVSISDTVHISVVPNNPPSISIISPANGQIFASPAVINLEAAALDPDGRIISVDFHNGSNLLNPIPERKLPYTYQWQNISPGAYTITAKAMDNWGAVTTSSAINFTVTSSALPVSNTPGVLDGKIGIEAALSFQLAPNPANSILTIYTTGLRSKKQATLSVVSPLGVVIKTKQLTGLSQTITLDVSSLVSGMYVVKITNGDKIMYRQFVKL